MVIGFESAENEAAFAVSNTSSAQDEIESAQDEFDFIENSLGMKLIRIPAGTFMMGSPRSEPDRLPKEELHEVSITRPFYMSIHEVTQAQFGNAGTAYFGGARHPMENVLWRRAVSFCTRLSNRPEESRAGRRYRLPTEAEWEYACRAGTTTPFHTGESLSSREANFNGNYPYGGAGEGPYLEMTAPVGSYEPNAFGLYDMHGNVAEWCADFYDPDYYENSPEEDPLGPQLGIVRTDFGGFHMVERGGCWLDDARGCRSAYRFRGNPRARYQIIGFRVVCEVTADPE
jgi:formylglycine-generating enzyme required for sulfatase activity